MQLAQLMTSEELQEARVPQAYFARLVGISRMRVSQLIKAGLLKADGPGVLLIKSLERYWYYQQHKGDCDVSLFVSRYMSEEED